MELQHWGFNALTVSLVGTVVFTCIQFWGMFKQTTRIWKNRSGASVSVLVFAFGTSAFFSAFLMGVEHRNFALIFNGSLCLINLLVLIELGKFKGFSRTEIGMMVLLAVYTALNIILPYKDGMYFVLGMGQVASIGLQPVEIVRNKSSGMVEIRTLLSFYLSNYFWTVYAFAIGNWPLEIIGITAAVILTITIVVWWIYQEKPQTVKEPVCQTNP